MEDKSLQEKAVDIKGKKYVLVSDRVLYFNETYPNGSITTELVSSTDAKQVVVKATINPDCAQTVRLFTGYSQAVVGEGMVNKTAALENAETSAVGRALAFMGIGVIDSVASVDEIHKAVKAPETPLNATRTKAEPRDAKPSTLTPAKREIAAKARIVDLIENLNGDKPEFESKQDAQNYYANEVQRYTSRSLALATLEELESIGDELAVIWASRN